jgi:4-methylaminobutanoate oxidase (formaldehyde-forming)
LGEVKGIDGLLIATGCSGAGISISGGVGLGISKMAAGHKNPFDFGFFKPDRYGLFDPFCQAHLSSCAAARSAKISG